MARWRGKVGYAKSSEVAPGVWKDTIEERSYSGDILQNTGRWATSSDTTNDDLNVSNKISIVADPFASHNYHSMKYVTFMGTKWKVTSVEVLYPRLILMIGGVYNE